MGTKNVGVWKFYGHSGAVDFPQDHFVRATGAQELRSCASPHPQDVAPPAERAEVFIFAANPMELICMGKMCATHPHTSAKSFD
jgi:hypothetical protein